MTVERTKHEIQTPFGIVLLTLCSKTRDGDDRAEYSTKEGEPLQLSTTNPQRVTSVRRITLTRLVLLRSKHFPQDGWSTSSARGQFSQIYFEEASRGVLLAQRSCPASDSKVAKVTDYLKTYLETWIAAHPVEVQEAVVQNAQEALWEAQEEVADAERRLDKLKGDALSATATLEEAERKLEQFRRLQPVTPIEVAITYK